MPPPPDRRDSPLRATHTTLVLLSGLLVVCAILRTMVPWSFLSFVAICLIVLICKFKMVCLAFTTARPPQITEDQRAQTSVYLLFVALVFTGYAFITRGNILYCYFAILFGLATVWLTKKLLKVAEEPRPFLLSLSSGAVELISTISVAFTAYFAFFLWVRTLPLNHATLLDLQQIEGRILSIHDRLDAFDPSKWLTLLIAVALIVSRILLSRYDAALHMVAGTRKAIGSISLWLHRLATVSLVVASFTFLATNTTGPPCRLVTQIRNMNSNYAELRGQVQEALVIEVKLQLVEQAWRQMPPPIVAQQVTLHQEAVWAARHYDMDGSELAVNPTRPPTPPVAQQPPPGDARNTLDAGRYRAPDIASAAGEASKDTTTIRTDVEALRRDMDEDLAEDVEAYVFDAGKLVDRSPFLKALSEHYPLLDAFIDPINDAVNDYIVHRLSPIVDRLVGKKLAAPATSLVTDIRDQARTFVQSASPHWHPPTVSDALWTSQLSARLIDSTDHLKQSSTRLEEDAAGGEERSFEKMVATAEQTIQYLDALQKVPGLEDDLSADAKVQLARIEQLPPDPHPLEGWNQPTPKVPQLLQDIPISNLEAQAKIKPPKTIPVADLHHPGLSPPVPPRPQPAPRPKVATPLAPRLDQITTLNNDCQARIVKAVHAPDVDRLDLGAALTPEVLARYQNISDDVLKNPLDKANLRRFDKSVPPSGILDRESPIPTIPPEEEEDAWKAIREMLEDVRP